MKGVQLMKSFKSTIISIVALLFLMLMSVTKASGTERNNIEEYCNNLSKIAVIFMNNRQYNPNRYDYYKNILRRELGADLTSSLGLRITEIYERAWNTPLASPNLRFFVVLDFARNVPGEVDPRCR
jgi:hypothetical protein